MALIAAVISMGHSLNAQVTAEGVETELQWQYLREQGCDEAQGFHLARPMRAEQLVEFCLDHASSNHSSSFSSEPLAPITANL